MEVGADSITLAQLKQLIKDMPKKKQSISVRFDYRHGVEAPEANIDEFFSIFEQKKIYEGRDLTLKALKNKHWNRLLPRDKLSFLASILDEFEHSSGNTMSVEKSNYSKIILYICQGAFDDLGSCSSKTAAIEENCKLLVSQGVFQLSFTQAKHIFSLLKTTVNPTNPKAATLTNDLDVALSIMFMLIVTCDLGEELLALNPSLALFLFELIDHLNYASWNVQYPIKKILYLLWKVLEKTLGSLEDAKKQKEFVHATFGTLPSVDSVYKPKASVHDLKNTFDYTCSRFTGFSPNIQLNSIPYFDLIYLYDIDNYSTLPSVPPNGLLGPEFIFYSPAAIQEKLLVTRNLLHIPVSKIQFCKERRYISNPEFKPKDWTETVDRSDPIVEKIEAVEEIYRLALPNLGNYIVTMLKILLSVSTKVGANNSSGSGRTIAQAVNDILSGASFNQPETILSSIQIAQNGLETARNKEIVAKAISFILLLFLKHSKNYHLFQFEFISQLLVDANCILLILKIFHQDLSNLLLKNEDFPFQSFFNYCVRNPDELMNDDSIMNSVVVEDKVEGSNDEEDLDSLGAVACKRNFYTFINLARVLQKLVKNKKHRIVLLAQYKAWTMMKKVLKVEQTDLNKYVLKTIKGFLPYIGKKWKQTNMRIITLAYLKLRPELSDAWINATEQSPPQTEQFQQLDTVYRMLTSSYNIRKYPHLFESLQKSLAKHPVSNSGTLFRQASDASNVNASVLDQYDVDIDEEFMNNYEQWLEDQVFSKSDDDEGEEGEIEEIITELETTQIAEQLLIPEPINLSDLGLDEILQVDQEEPRKEDESVHLLRVDEVDE